MGVRKKVNSNTSFRNTVVCAVSLATDKEVVVLVSRVHLFVTPRTAVCQDCPSFTISQSWLRLMSPESVMLSNHLNLCRPFSFWKEAGMQKHGRFVPCPGRELSLREPSVHDDFNFWVFFQYF